MERIINRNNVSGKQKLWEFIANRPSLLEMVEETLQEKETDTESKLRSHTEQKNFREIINEDKMLVTLN